MILGEAAALHGRDFLLVDHEPEAIAVMARRLSPYDPELVGCEAIRELIDAPQRGGTG